MTTAALIFPVVMLAQYLSEADISLIYIVVALLTALAFVSKIQVPKPRLKGILLMMAVGLVLLVIMVLSMMMKDTSVTLLGITLIR